MIQVSQQQRALASDETAHQENDVQFEIVQFHNDQIEAIRGADGRGFVSVKRISDNIGVDSTTQIRKLKKSHWAGAVEMTAPDNRGIEQTYVVIPVDSVPMWLVTIAIGKIAEPLRDKLRKYQLEARDVLARHFMPVAAPVVAPPAIKPTTSTLDLLSMGRLLIGSLEKQVELEQSVVVVQTEQVQLRAELEATRSELALAKADSARAVRTVTSESGYFTLVTWAEQHGVYLTPPNDSLEGKVVKAMCLDRGISPGQWKGPRYSVGTYPEHILYLWLDNYRSRGTSLRVANPA